MKPNQCNRCLAGTMRVTASRKIDESRRKLWLKCTNPRCGHKDTRVIPIDEAPADGR